MIREATARDSELVIELVHNFNDTYFGIPADSEKVERWFQQHLNAGVVYLGDRSIISGLFISDPVRNWDVLAETAWYAEGRDGLRLLRKFIQTARDREMDEVRMTTLNTTPVAALALLQRMGFEEIERSHRLAL